MISQNPCSTPSEPLICCFQGVKGVLRKLCRTQGILLSGNWYIRWPKTLEEPVVFYRWRGQVHHSQNKCGLAKAVRVQHMTEGKKMDGEHTQKALMEITMKKYLRGEEILELFLRTVGQRRFFSKDFKGSAKRKTPCFLGGFPCFFSQKARVGGPGKH